MVYFIKSGDFLKVGYSADVPKRMKQYETHNPNFELLYIINGDQKLEKQIQKELDEYRFRLEWFHVDDYVLYMVDYLREKYKDWVEDLDSVRLKMRDVEHEFIILLINTSKDVDNIACTKYFKQQWAEELKVPFKNIDSVIRKLIKKEILVSVTTSIYKLDMTKLDIDIIDKL